MSVSLLGGWFPAVLEVLAAGVLVVAVGWRNRQWRFRVLPVVVGATALVALIAAYPGARWAGITDPLPFSVWLWFGLAAGALIVLAAGWRSARWWRRGTAVLAAGLAALVCANGVNQFVGYYPTIDSAVNDWTDTPLPGQVSMAGLAHDAGTTRLPPAGRLVAVNIPATYSHFHHRQELVYLPPAWFQGVHRPTLPVVELIGGERGGPGDWVRLGNAVQVSDEYAHRHHGWAPILVFVDATARFDNDTECVNGPRGNSADHLDQDVPRYIEKTFGAARDARQWAVAGFSMGGTCALDLVVEHPDVFDHFVDISGDLAPYTSTPAASLQDLYGGNVALEKANEPLLVMHAHHGKYTNVNGLFLTSTEELRHQHEAEELSKAAAKAGIWSRVEISPGTHVWQFAAPAFASAYPWLANQLALPVSPHQETRHTKPA
ncbi:alpha/beta hydrolase-fold protein [Kribbella sp. NPDC004875]|uniref:alpha/beta hydrolase n=1 Tax=Kribbella sp. NPDC004875 TaxID=3364107 RepID=UPI0036D0B792